MMMSSGRVICSRFRLLASRIVLGWRANLPRGRGPIVLQLGMDHQ